ncbi:MAG: hypothetical protein FWD94_02560 [Treponema sp.]|nr:hypothetical protein [Treponema sp.]
MNGKTMLTAALAAIVVLGLAGCADIFRAPGVSRSPQGYTSAKDFIWELNNFDGKSVTITGYTGKSTKVRIPPYFEIWSGEHFGDAGWDKTPPVTGIAPHAFEGKGLTSVTIPESVYTVPSDSDGIYRRVDLFQDTLEDQNYHGYYRGGEDNYENSFRGIGIGIGDYAFANNRLADTGIVMVDDDFRDGFSSIKLVDNRGQYAGSLYNNPYLIAITAFWNNPPLEKAQPYRAAMSMKEIVAFLGLNTPPAKGTTGNEALDDIAWRDSWKTFRAKVVASALRQIPMLAAYVVYSPSVTVGNSVDYDKKTVDVTVNFRVEVAAPPPLELFQLINGFNRELHAMGRNSDRNWNISYITTGEVLSSLDENDRSGLSIYMFSMGVEIVTNNGRVVDSYYGGQGGIGTYNMDYDACLVSGEPWITAIKGAMGYMRTYGNTYREKPVYARTLRVPLSDAGNVSARVGIMGTPGKQIYFDGPPKLSVQVLTEEEFGKLR